MYVAIDRFEGDLAVLEDEGMRLYPVPRSCLPEDARPAMSWFGTGNAISPPRRKPKGGGTTPAAWKISYSASSGSASPACRT